MNGDGFKNHAAERRADPLHTWKRKIAKIERNARHLRRYIEADLAAGRELSEAILDAESAVSDLADLVESL